MSFRVDPLFLTAHEACGRVAAAGAVHHHPNRAEECVPEEIVTVASRSSLRTVTSKPITLRPLSPGLYALISGRVRLLDVGLCYQFPSGTWLTIVNNGTNPAHVAQVEHVPQVMAGKTVISPMKIVAA
jgi:hypothetical protein